MPYFKPSDRRHISNIMAGYYLHASDCSLLGESNGIDFEKEFWAGPAILTDIASGFNPETKEQYWTITLANPEDIYSTAIFEFNDESELAGHMWFPSRETF